MTPQQTKLVNAIIDGELATLQIAQDAVDAAKPLAAKLVLFLRNTMRLRASGKLTSSQAEAHFRRLYMMITLAGFVEVAQDVKDHGQSISVAIIDAAQALGPDVKSIPAIRKVTVLARIQEKRGVVNKDGELTNG